MTNGLTFLVFSDISKSKLVPRSLSLAPKFTNLWANRKRKSLLRLQKRVHYMLITCKSKKKKTEHVACEQTPIGEGRKQARCDGALRPPSHARITSLADFLLRPASLGIPFEGYEHVDLILTGHLCTLQSMRLETVKRVYPDHNVSWVNNFTQDN